VGIAPEHLPHIFDRFYRVDKARSRTAGGAGLGLSICRWIVEAHGGSISIESALEQGTAFTVALSVAAPAAA
jgi:signal transduction histidine kinase